VTLEASHDLYEFMTALGCHTDAARLIKELADRGEQLFFFAEEKGVARLCTLASPPQVLDVPISIVQVRLSYTRSISCGRNSFLSLT
jgi:hypothetical protein